MNDLDLKEIIWMLQERLMKLENSSLLHRLVSSEEIESHSKFIAISDKYIKEVLDSIREVE